MSRQTWWPTSRQASWRRRVSPDLEGGIKTLEVGTKQSLLCGVGRVVSIPFCMALLNQCCTQKFGFWQLRRISPPLWAPRQLGGGGGAGGGACGGVRWGEGVTGMGMGMGMEGTLLPYCSTVGGPLAGLGCRGPLPVREAAIGLCSCLHPATPHPPPSARSSGRQSESGGGGEGP